MTLSFTSTSIKRLYIASQPTTNSSLDFGKGDTGASSAADHLASQTHSQESTKTSVITLSSQS